MIDLEPTPFWVAADITILTIRDGRLHVLLIERGKPPFRGRPALPGGFVEADEDLKEAAERELREETGIGGLAPHLEQVATYGTPRRDPRHRVISVSYLAVVPNLALPTPGADAAAARWQAVGPSGPGRQRLAFDHDQILEDALERARAKLEYSSLALAFCPEHFTIGELRAVYEAVWGIRLDPRNFHRKVTGVPGFIEATGEVRKPPTGRPAALYRAGKATSLYPPMLRPGSGT